MKKLVDRSPKANHAVRDSFLNVPDSPTSRQTKIIKEIRKLLKYGVN